MLVKRHRSSLFLFVLMMGVLAYITIHARNKTPSTLIMASENANVEPENANVGTGEPHVGNLAPNFVLPDVQGQSRTFSQYQGHRVVLAFFCGCDRCHHAAREIASLQRQHKLPVVVSVVAEVPGAARQFAEETGLQGVVLSDQDDSVVYRYDSAFCPRLWGISSVGQITYRSPIALEGTDLTKALHALLIVPDQLHTPTTPLYSHL